MPKNDALTTPMLNNSVSKSLGVEKTKPSHMSAPVETKLGRVKAPGFMFRGRYGESVLGDPSGPVEKRAHLLPVLSSESKPKHLANQAHVGGAEAFMFVISKGYSSPRTRRPRRRRPT